MSIPDKKTLGNEVYESLLITVGAVVISMGTKKLFKEPLGTPQTAGGIQKLGAAIAGGTMLVKYFQSRNWIPDDPFKQM